ncbi:uncharacterized protein ARMOST_18646 [Armillaria ostoyae]|uniref:Uncharacterized protein n=1 Tax=Armillaria ostoyae TaxID=47428 RepID=A0A284S2A8_ARMOS|nr:uncharacterized protein ARMOST_18646 [Armillaria ostoyae]
MPTTFRTGVAAEAQEQENLLALERRRGVSRSLDNIRMRCRARKDNSPRILKVCSCGAWVVESMRTVLRSRFQTARAYIACQGWRLRRYKTCPGISNMDQDQMFPSFPKHINDPAGISHDRASVMLWLSVSVSSSLPLTYHYDLFRR